MAVGREVERKFLVNELPVGWKRRSSVSIVQGYLPIMNNDLQIRLRRKEEESFITIKAGHGCNRLEQEIRSSGRRLEDATLDEMETLWQQSKAQESR